VVKFSGSLRGDLFKWMVEMEKKVDLCLCLGTSLSGMNADRMANTPARKSLKTPPKALGTVIINIQQTPLDHKTVVRVWAKLDDAFKILAEKLGLTIKPTSVTLSDKHVYIVPYNEKGIKDNDCQMKWDLSDGSAIKIPIEGAMNYGATGKVIGTREGHFSVELKEQEGPVRRLLGSWWVESALKGTVPQLPVINVSPKVKRAAIESIVESMSLDEPEPQEKEVEKEEHGSLPKSVRIIQSHNTINDPKSGDNKHSWGLSLEPSAAKFVTKVTWTLHSTFHDPVVECTEPPFEIRRRGWGTFVIKVAIQLKSGHTLNAKHELTFDGEGDEVHHTEVPIPH